MKDHIERIIWQAKFEADTNWIKATQTLKDAIEQYPDEVKLYDELGNLYFFKDIYEEAAEYYKQALTHDYHNVDIIFKLAYCHLINHDFEKAEHYFDMISGIIPEATYNKCVALYKLNKGYQAIEQLEDLIDMSIYSDKPFILLGKLYLEFERYNKVFDLVEKSEKLFGKVAELSYIRGTAYFQTRQWLKAYVDFQTAESKIIETPTFFRMYALNCEKIGKTEKAIELLLNSIEKFPTFYGAYYDLVKIYFMYNRNTEALKIAYRLKEQGITLAEVGDNERGLFDSVFETLTKDFEE